MDEQENFQKNSAEFVARLTGGMAHVFNDILTVIRGYTEILKMKCSTCAHEQETFEIILKNCDRAAEQINKIVSFADEFRNNLSELDMSKTTEEFISSLGEILNDQIKLDYNFDAVPPILADKRQMQMILSNLVSNAIEAMPEGGRISVRTMDYELWQESAQQYRLNSQGGKYVKLIVEDTGKGIDENALGKIFQPFYTSKSNSLGLGLSAVQEIIKKHAGHISVKSDQGKGTAFYLYLPVQN